MARRPRSNGTYKTVGRRRTVGRPSILTQDEWDEIQRRHLNGERATHLCREFKISLDAFRRQVKPNTKKIRELARRKFEIECEIKAMPKALQVETYNIVEELQAISVHLAISARNSSMTASHLTSVALNHAKTLNMRHPKKANDIIEDVSALTEVAQKSAQIGLNLIAVLRGSDPRYVPGGNKTLSKAEVIEELQNRGLPTSILDRC